MGPSKDIKEESVIKGLNKEFTYCSLCVCAFLLLVYVVVYTRCCYCLSRRKRERSWWWKHHT